MPRVSIVVPGYNAEKYIKECLDSIIVQTLDDIEVLLIDDGSTDGTGNIFDEYAAKYPFIRVVHQKNMGIFKTRAVAMHEVTGDYVGWVDADDFIEPTMFEEMYNAAVVKNSEMVYCNYAYYPKGIAMKTKWFRQYRGKVDVSFVERNSQFWNKLVSRELLIKLGISDILPTCFEESMIKVLLHAKNPVEIDKELYHYRIGQGSMSSRYNEVSYYKKFIDASRQLSHELGGKETTVYWQEYFSFRVIYYQLMTAIVAANAGDKPAFYETIHSMHKENPRFWRNQHYWPVLHEIYGGLKAAVIGYLVPVNYYITRLMCAVVFR